MSTWETTRESLAWFRPSIRHKILRAWGQAFALILLGAVALGVLRVEDVDFGSPALALYLAGLLLVVAGPLWIVTRISRLMRGERCLSLERHALVWLEGDGPGKHIAWDEIEGVDLEGDALVVRTATDALHLPARFEDIEPQALAALLLDLRRRFLMGLPMRVALDRP